MQKIAPQHLERLAVIYLRQSSPKQVRENFRSTERQYGLAEEAARLGWEPERILTVDGDLGVSGRDTQARGGYKELVGRVCLGEVGAIFGLEVSRLARSSAETQRLLEYCGLTDTLVIDTDGIYDLRDFNDQLVLGVKGQLAQAELHVMAVRLQGAKRHAAERGELRFPLPVGLVYDAEGQTIIDPDEEVQAAIADLFKAFVADRLGVRRRRRVQGQALSPARVRRRVGGRAAVGQADARARGRRALEPQLRRCVRVRALPLASGSQARRHDHHQDGRAAALGVGDRDPDHHEGYISWEQFLANEQRLAANNNRNGQRPPREGAAICQGIVRCGACGGSMTTLHRREGSYYECGHSRADHVNTPGCRSVKATVVDRADRPPAARGARARGDRARARRRCRARGPPRALKPRVRAARRARPL